MCVLYVGNMPHMMEWRTHAYLMYAWEANMPTEKPEDECMAGAILHISFHLVRISVPILGDKGILVRRNIRVSYC